jgi:hypothetical protein
MEFAENDPGSRPAIAGLGRDDEVSMPPRIRALSPRPPYARKKAPAPEAPRVFREFVETLQRLDAAAPKRSPRLRARKQRYVGNGARRPAKPRNGAG